MLLEESQNHHGECSLSLAPSRLQHHQTLVLFQTEDSDMNPSSRSYSRPRETQHDLCDGGHPTGYSDPRAAGMDSHTDRTGDTKQADEWDMAN